MWLIDWLLSHHVTSVLSVLFTVLFAGSVLDRRRPVGSAFAWLIALVFVPFLAVPLYLMFGGRKFATRAAGKPKLDPVTRDSGDQTLSELHWLDDGVAAFACFMAEIAAARSSIRIVTFVIGSDDTGRAILAALTARAASGVAVHLLIDDFLYHLAPKAELRRLAQAGGHVARFMPLFHVPFRGRANLRNHRKIALFDGDRAIVGGMNLADEYMGPRRSATRWRDLSARVRGAAVARLDAVFAADFAFATGKPLALTASRAARGQLPVRVVPSGPDAERDPIYDALMTAIFRAERRVWIATPYFVPDEGLMRALEVAARRDVDVCIVVPARSNHALADLVAAPALRSLEADGCKVYRYLPGMLHAKAVLIDDHLAMVGSANFDMRSLWLDFEIALFFSGDAEVRWLAQWFDVTTARASLGAPRSGYVRSRVESVARLLTPLL